MSMHIQIYMETILRGLGIFILLVFVVFNQRFFLDNIVWTSELLPEVDHLVNDEQSLPTDKELCDLQQNAVCQFQCDQCDFVATNPKDIKSHQKAGHNEDKEKSTNFECMFCEFCNLVFFSSSSLATHKQLKHKIYICEFCSSEFASSTSLFFHKEDKHKTHKCEFCCSAYFSSHYLACHKQLKHKIHICEFCSSEFASSTSLFIHKEDKHKTHKCEFCSSAYFSSRSLATHKQLKHQIYRCEFCSSVVLFASSTALLFHKEDKHKTHKM